MAGRNTPAGSGLLGKRKLSINMAYSQNYGEEPRTDPPN